VLALGGWNVQRSQSETGLPKVQRTLSLREMRYRSKTFTPYFTIKSLRTKSVLIEPRWIEEIDKPRSEKVDGENREATG
jgi:hypothetical protein